MRPFVGIIPNEQADVPRRKPGPGWKSATKLAHGLRCGKAFHWSQQDSPLRHPGHEACLAVRRRAEGSESRVKPGMMSFRKRPIADISAYQSTAIIVGNGVARSPLWSRSRCLLAYSRLCFVTSYKTIPELVARLRLSIIPNIGMLTHTSLRATARSLSPRASLPNQTASFACSAKSASWRYLFVFSLTCGDVAMETKRFFSR